MTSIRRLASFAGLTVLAVFLAMPSFALAQDVGVDPTDYLNFIPERYRSLALAVLAGGYTALIIARRFTSPTSKAGIFVRSILSGWKHPDELPGKLTPPVPAPVAVPANLQDVAGPGPKGFGTLGLMLVLAAILGAAALLPVPAHGQDVAGSGTAGTSSSAPTTVIDTSTLPVTPFTTVDLGTAWRLSLHLNVTVLAFQYDLSHGEYLGKLPIGGMYVLTAEKLLGAGVGLGGSLAFDSGRKPSGEIDGALVSPRWALSPALKLHLAVTGGRQFGAVTGNRIGLAPTLEF